MLVYRSIEDFVIDESFHEYVVSSSVKSVEFWENWILKHPERAEDLEKAKDLVLLLTNTNQSKVHADKKETFEQIWNKIIFSSELTKTKQVRLSNWIKVAALILLVVGVSIIWQRMANESEGDNLVTYQEIIVPIGEKAQLILPDGSHVWINSGSRFKYPTRFGADTREVLLTGEAFFDVTHNEKLPFIVKTKNSIVKVLGTAFNVRSYPDDRKTQTSVLRGLVSVLNTKSNETFIVKPKQMLVINEEKMDDHLEPVRNTNSKVELIEKVNIEAVSSWKDQLLIFADEPFNDMASKMERWFNIKIEIQDSSLKQERYNGKFVHNENIYQVLEIIKLTTPIKYRVIDNTKIIIERK
jgi:ferric-dicitrate binding protein FerR (iron transport regulator)